MSKQRQYLGLSYEKLDALYDRAEQGDEALARLERVREWAEKRLRDPGNPKGPWKRPAMEILSLLDTHTEGSGDEGIFNETGAAGRGLNPLDRIDPTRCPTCKNERRKDTNNRLQGHPDHGAICRDPWHSQ